MRPSQLVSLCILLSSGVAATARAEDVPAPSELQATVEHNFLTPLARWQDHRSRFSRARLPPEDRRVRMTHPELERDARGQDFAVFAMDSRFRGDDTWDKDALVGCLYPASGDIFVKYGDEYVRGAMLYGKKVAAAPEGVCHPVAVQAAREPAPAKPAAVPAQQLTRSRL